MLLSSHVQLRGVSADAGSGDRTARDGAHARFSLKSFVDRLFRKPGGVTPSAPEPSPPEGRAVAQNRRPLIHDLNNVLGVVIGNFDEQLELLNEPGDVDRARLKQLAEDGLSAALRGAALTRREPNQDGT